MFAPSGEPGKTSREKRTHSVGPIHIEEERFAGSLAFRTPPHVSLNLPERGKYPLYPRTHHRGGAVRPDRLATEMHVIKRERTAHSTIFMPNPSSEKRTQFRKVVDTK